MNSSISLVGLSDSNRVLLGAFGSGPSSFVEFYGNLGLDYTLLDLEHCGFSPWDSPKLENFV